MIFLLHFAVRVAKNHFIETTSGYFLFKTFYQLDFD